MAKEDDLSKAPPRTVRPPAGSSLAAAAAADGQQLLPSPHA
jgi:hypothetical protein